jgi:hypothetical protein
VTEEIDDELWDFEPGELLSSAVERHKHRQFVAPDAALSKEVAKPDILPEWSELSDQPTEEAAPQPAASEYVPNKVDSAFTDEAGKVIADAQGKERLGLRAYRPVAWLFERLGRRTVDNEQETGHSGSGWRHADNMRRSSAVQMLVLGSVVLVIVVAMIMKGSSPSVVKDSVGNSPAMAAVSNDLISSGITYGSAGIQGTTAAIQMAPQAVSSPADVVPEWAHKSVRISRRVNESELRERLSMEEQVKDLQRAVLNTPSDLSLRLQLARLLTQLARLKEAVEQYTVVMKGSTLADQDKLAFADALAACRENELASALYLSLRGKPKYQLQAEAGLASIANGSAAMRYRRTAPLELPPDPDDGG